MGVKYIKYEITLTTESPFRVGRKRDPFTTIEQPIIILGNRVVIPGTTLKGALREAIERYLIERYSNEIGMKPCIPATPQTITPDEQELIRKGVYKGTGCHYPCNPRNQRDRRCKNVLRLNNTELWAPEERKQGLHYICPACYLLGAQGLVGFITVPFLYSDIQPHELPALRIDRSTGTVATGVYGTYRTYQIVPENTVFKGILEILLEDSVKGWKLGEPRPLQGLTLGDLWLNNNPDWKDPDRIIRELIVERLASIKRLGGFKSQGAGFVRIEVSPLQ